MQSVRTLGPNGQMQMSFSGSSSMSYFVGAIIENGEPYAIFPRSIGVTIAPDSRIAIGEASEVGWTEKDGALWSLKIGGKAVVGLFIIAAGEFVQFEYVSELARPGCRVAWPL